LEHVAVTRVDEDCAIGEVLGYEQSVAFLAFHDCDAGRIGRDLTDGNVFRSISVLAIMGDRDQRQFDEAIGT
jgi:hypothetical protein